MNRNLGRLLLGGIVLTSMFGCISAAVSTAQPTAVELQLLGVYEELDKDLVHVASMRGAALGARGADNLSDRALQARAVQSFNEDDVLAFKVAGCVAEKLDGRLVEHPCDFQADDPAWKRRRRRVVKEENEARASIAAWVAYQLNRQQGRPVLEGASWDRALQRVMLVLARLLREGARPGHLIETRPGHFEPR